MKVYQLVIAFLTVTFFMACKGNEESQDVSPEQDDNVEVGPDTMNVEAEEGATYTAWAAIDGPDNAIWITTPEEFLGDEAPEIPAFETLHIIPNTEYYEPYDIQEWMMGIIVNDFQFWDPFKDYTGPVEIYYDVTKTKMLSSYNLREGKPEGRVVIWTPEGDQFLDWTYKDGVWVKADYSPYSADWSFKQDQSKLRVMDSEYGIYTEDGISVVKLMPTFRYHMDEQNTLYTIMEKESFNSPFMINGDVFTGRLEAYWTPSSMDDDIYYTLDFTDGWLNGDVKIYNEWGELELHELFVMGELDTTLFVMDYSEMDGMAKPIIYLYPEKEMDVQVKLDIDGYMTHSYPAYEHGWSVNAKPDGTLIDESGKEYYALYWEGENKAQFDVSEGFVIPGDQTSTFLEESLEILGLNRREANEFIVFWLPILENNPYNLIHFSSSQYEDIAKLNVNPAPETMIRVMMVYKPLDHSIDIPIQDLNKLKKERKGFTVVEWGGSLLEEPLN